MTRQDEQAAQDFPRMQILGVLESCFKEKFGTPRQPHLAPGSTARLRVHPRYSPGHSLAGLANFSHVWLLSWFHLNTNKTFHPKIHPPRMKGGKIGVFASRSPHRPNPIGLSLARLEKVEGDTLHLSGIDLIDGTPILDVKPYLHFSDSAPAPQAGWVPDHAFPELEVEVSARAAKDLERCAGAENLRALIIDVLGHDPRNRRDATQMKEGADLEFFICDREVHFSVTGNKATVTRVAAAGKFEKKFRRKKPGAPGR
ncbi:MAG: tRNA (N6-threonylcarbamoyladenosine(37)-N6)-methyltransferase TrmO [Elusimicrobia bacterium GWA2_62_23]|nr:MAG: tRNA (N6-threonylcarbamoyladenosine(37)-N6)-methyltransferase TrmO [Elusimicrobia bacterium GWA2_62_23]OGR66971.1 MAG: tRNA (N6-threonylcarbamoyladenosine(37)-N6)-methyltransferase TrmO [Elusimicrobia bacterium GWC2_63_65]